MKPVGAMICTRPASTSSLGGDAFDAAEVVDVAVGVDHRLDGPSLMSVVEAGDAAAVSVLISGSMMTIPLTLDDRHIGQVESADLVDTVGDFVKPCWHWVRLAPEARVDRVRCLAVEELVGVQVPDRVSAAFLIAPTSSVAISPPVSVVEILGVVGRVIITRRCVAPDAGVTETYRSLVLSSARVSARCNRHDRGQSATGLCRVRCRPLPLGRAAGYGNGMALISHGAAPVGWSPVCRISATFGVRYASSRSGG